MVEIVGAALGVVFAVTVVVLGMAIVLRPPAPPRKQKTAADIMRPVDKEKR